MLRVCFLIAALFGATVAYGQQQRAFELDLIGRYDKHADYTTRFFNRSYTNDTKLWGKSFGLNLNYVHAIDKHVNASIGAGYYHLGVDKIHQTTPFGIIASGRNIDYRHPSGIQPLFSTNKYHYDNLNCTIGIDYTKPLCNNMDLVIGGNFTYWYSFSQLYHISWGSNIRYRTNHGQSLGFAANMALGVSYRFLKSKNYVSPKLIVPVYQQLCGDSVFGEDNSVKMLKWLNGAGLSFAVGRYF